MERVEVPVRLDYPLLEQLLVAQLFSGPKQTVDLLGHTRGCNSIVLSEPSLSQRSGQLEVQSKLRALIGFGVPGACTGLLNVAGRVRVIGQPDIRRNGTAVGFVPSRVILFATLGEEIQNATLQSLADSSVRNMLERYELDLGPQLKSVGALLPDVLPRHTRTQIEQLLETVRIERLAIQEETLDATIGLTIESTEAPRTAERALTDAELKTWEERWQLMDSLLVLTVKHYAAATQFQELRDALLDALIESRYRLRDALAETPTEGDDLVREWFLQSWRSLAPSLRKIGAEQAQQQHLLLLSVIAATDALSALDRLGPSFGLDVSTDGLRRLARMINDGADDQLLQYTYDVDPELRQLFEASLKASSPPTAWRWQFSLFPQAVAADTSRLNSWAPKRSDLREYLPQVADLLKDAASDAQSSRDLDRQYHQLFRNLVLATAWQESCWRHYVVSKDRKLVPLRSGTGDVGLMQVNERVWRGFYNQQSLRWDINYNGGAGAEVLIDYLVRYALRRGEHQHAGGLTNLARASYSAYNGGPSRLSRYRDPNSGGYGRKVDDAFWEKYQQVAAGDELAVASCY